MQQSNQPAKFLLPIAQNDASKADIPVTTPDASRASQSLGFPPLTGQPPEAGGVPPQLPDMNGLLNTVSRIPWWVMLGGRFGYDNAFATNANINGYPLGAELASADGLGSFFSTVDNNVSNPDTNGAGWAPGYHYGATALTGQTGGNVTLTQAQAAKRVITVAGTLTSNLVLIVPGWRYDWTVYNNTSGAFSVSVRTAAGSAAAIAQNGAPTPVVCDGINCSLLAANIGQGTSSAQAARIDQTSGRLINVQVFDTNRTYIPTVGTQYIIVEGVGAGGAGGGAPAVAAGQLAVGAGGGAGGYFRLRVTENINSTPVIVGVGGPGFAGGQGSGGSPTSFGTYASAAGGNGGSAGVATASFPHINGYGDGAEVVTGGSLVNAAGAAGNPGFGFGATTGISGVGGSSHYGGGANAVINGRSNGRPANSPGAGGSGGLNMQSGAAVAGGAGANGRVIVYEYAGG